MEAGSFYSHQIEVTPRFCKIANGKIDNRTTKYKRVPVKTGAPIFFVEKFTMTPETATAGKATMGASVNIPGWILRQYKTVFQRARSKQFKEVDVAREQWKLIQKIGGGIFLSPHGNLIWVSDFDLAYFKKIKP